MGRRGLAVFILLAGWLAAATATPAWAAGPFDGRWAADAPACRNEHGGAPLLVVTPFSLRWRDAACAVGTSYRVGEAWYVSARCWAGGAAASVPIRLQRRGERLVLDWAGAPPQELTRCP
jgi:hypothetical protein